MTLSRSSHLVVATDRSGLAVARIAARKNKAAALTERVRERYGIDLPRQPRRVEHNGLAWIGVGVETWLAVADLADADRNQFAASLRQSLDASAAVSDQIGSYVVVRLTGPKVREALLKFVPLDLHPRVFDPGSAASTIAAHIPLTLWRLEDGAEGLPLFELAVPRSYAECFRQTVAESAAEFGFIGAAA